MGGFVFAFTIAARAVKNLIPMNTHVLFDMAFLSPAIATTITYAVLQSMREGYMFDLNRRYYRLRPPK